MNCFELGVHMAGTVNTHWMSSALKSSSCVSWRMSLTASSPKNLIERAKTFFASTALPLAAYRVLFKSISYERKKNYKSRTHYLWTMPRRTGITQKMRFCRQCGGGGGGGGGLFGRLRLYVLLFGNLSVCLFVCFFFSTFITYRNPFFP